MTMTARSGRRTLRPLRHLPWRTIAAGNVVLMLPATAVVVVLGLARPLPVVLLTALVLLATAVVVVPALQIRTDLASDGVTTHWIGRLGSARIPRARIRSAVLRSVYKRDGMSTYGHLFLLDQQHRTVLRMSTRWWSEEQQAAVVEHLGVLVESHGAPVHLAELRRSCPEQLRWSERHQVLAPVALVVGGFLLCLLFAGLATVAVR